MLILILEYMYAYHGSTFHCADSCMRDVAILHVKRSRAVGSTIVYLLLDALLLTITPLDESPSLTLCRP